MSDAIEAGALRPLDRGDPHWVISRHVARRATRGAIIWGIVFGIFVVSTIVGFVKGYPTLQQRAQITHSLQSFSMLIGVPHHAETVAGFTSWRVLVAIAIIGAIWGLLTSTGLLRGEEDAGRWELLLAGQTTKRWAAVQALLGLGRALAAMFLVVALITLAAGRMPAAHFTIVGSLLFSLAMVAGAAMFLAIGALASQLSATRGQAAMISAIILGASYVVRMVADSSRSLGWMRWLSPIGWIEELRPLRDPQPLALVPIIALVLACAVATVLLAERRDLYASVLRDSDGRLRNTLWVVGPLSLALRLSRTSALGWLTGIACMAAVEGSVARSASTLLSSSPSITVALGRLGVRKATEGFLGLSFLFIGVLIAVVAASQIAAIRDEEASGRLDNLLVRPVHRVAWLTGRLGVSLALIVLAGITAGLFTWIGAASQHTGVSMGKLVQAGLNVTAPGVFVLGVGALVLGFRPRLSAPVSYGIVAWSFLVNLLGTFIKGLDWLRDTSLLTHIALAPSVKPDWGAVTIMALLGLAAAALGAVAFQDRDVEPA